MKRVFEIELPDFAELSAQDIQEGLADALGFSVDIKVRDITELAETIPLGLKKVALASGYAINDDQKIENEVVIYSKDCSDKSWDEEFTEDVGKSSTELGCLVRFKVYAHQGADELIRRLDHACTANGEKSILTVANNKIETLTDSLEHFMSLTKD
jgi:hypothetical protein